MGGSVDRFNVRRDRAPRGLQYLDSTAIEVLDEVLNRSGIGGIDRPARSGRADALAQRPIACTDDGETGDECLGHDMTERLRVGTRE